MDRELGADFLGNLQPVVAVLIGQDDLFESAAGGSSLTALLPELLRLKSAASLRTWGLGDGRLATGTSSARGFDWDATEERLASGALVASVTSGASGAGVVACALASGAVAAVDAKVSSEAGAATVCAETMAGALCATAPSCLPCSVKNVRPAA